MKHSKLLASAALVLAVACGSAFAGTADDLQTAARNDSQSRLSAIVEAGGSVNARLPDGETVLTEAIRFESKDVIEYCLARKDIEVDMANIRGESPLMMAAIKGDIALVKRLVHASATINRLNPGWAPLHYAVYDHSGQCLKYLLEQGADPNVITVAGVTPLMLCAHDGLADNADILTKAGADRKLRQADGLSAADIAKRSGHDNLLSHF